MAKTGSKPDNRAKIIKAKDCKVGHWVHNTTADSALHGYWHLCIGVRVGVNNVCIWLEMDEYEETELYHVESSETIVVSDDEPKCE